MKKILALLLVIALTLCFFSCKDEQNSNNDATSQSTENGENQNGETTDSSFNFPWNDGNFVFPDDEF